jgi:flagellin
MGMRISTNVSALNVQRNLANSQRVIQTSMGQLASGSRINKGADDAAGLAISEGLKAQMRSGMQAARNANDGISMIQTAEGGLGEISNITTRIRELAMQSASDNVSDRERGFLNKEVDQLKSEIDRIANVTTWGRTKLLDGNSPTFEFQVGLYGDEKDDRIAWDPSVNNATLSGLSLEGLDFASKESARDALAVIDDAQLNVNGMRANLGALQNRMTSAADNLLVQHENLSSANSRIRDTDIAQASSEMTRNNILLQSGIATMAQANSVSAAALKLIG